MTRYPTNKTRWPLNRLAAAALQTLALTSTGLAGAQTLSEVVVTANRDAKAGLDAAESVARAMWERRQRGYQAMGYRVIPQASGLFDPAD